MLRWSSPLLCLLPVALFPLVASPLFAQSATADTLNPITTIHVDAPTVIVDVVVTDDKGNPVIGLNKEDFRVLEDDKPQEISYFEAHVGTSASVAGLSPQRAPTLPPNTFTNVPLAAPTDAVNVLLMDALNTPMQDQMYVHKEMVKYLAAIPPGTRVAVFLLSNRLRIVQGFTTDADVLRAAIARSSTNPAMSALLPNVAQNVLDQAAVGEIKSTPGGAVQDSSAQALQDFQTQQANYQKDERVEYSLQAFQQIAAYLAGIPGRKNVMWFSGAFPLNVFADAEGRTHEEEVKKTVNLLTMARVSIYPIAASGLAPDSLYDVSNPPDHNLDYHLPGGTSAFQEAVAIENKNLHDDAAAHIENQNTMEQLARDTGGRAIYNRNTLSESLARDINNGANFYAIAYNPANHSEKGKLRSIEVQLTSPARYDLAYRRGYFEKTPKEIKAAVTVPAKDPLRPMMDRGMPDFTELRYRMQLVESAGEPTSQAAHAGDNPALQGSLTRFRINFMLAADGLTFETAPDGVRHGSIEVALVVYSHDGKSLNWEVRSLELALKPEQYAAVRQSGIPFHFDIDVPAGDVYLRTGIHDIASGRTGTLEIPLSTVTPSAVATK